MLKFKQFISEEFFSENRGFIKASGQEVQRHKEKYIDPHIGSKEPTHTIGKAHGDIAAGSQVKIHGTETVGKNLHAIVSTKGSSKKVSVPVNKIHKPGETPENKGAKYETDFFNRMKSHGLVPKGTSAAGSTAGTDVSVINKRKNATHKGKVQSSESVFHGEVKEGVTAAMGQLTIHHSTEKGWHITDKARANRPEYARHVEKAGILEHMNKHYNPDKHVIPTTASGRAKSVVIKHNNLEPANAYLKDHHAHFVQVGGHGTYRVGEKDHTGHGLPPLTGKGKWTVREKQAGNKKARTVMFQPDGKKNLTPSSVDLDKDDHLHAFKKTLGHV